MTFTLNNLDVTESPIEEKVFFAVCDFVDKDRESPIVETFSTREAAEKFAAEWSAEGGCTILIMSEE